MSTTAQKLAEARKHLKKAEERADRLYGRVGVPDDPGAVSGVRRTTTPRQAAKSAALTGRALDAYQEAERAQTKVEWLEAKLRREEKEAAADATATVDLDRLKPGDHIRHRVHGVSLWDIVRRVNSTTVTCEPRWEGHDAPRVPLPRILETRHQEDRT